MEPKVTLSRPPVGLRRGAGAIRARAHGGPPSASAQTEQLAEDALYERLFPKGTAADSATPDEDALYERLFGSAEGTR